MTSTSEIGFWIKYALNPHLATLWGVGPLTARGVIGWHDGHVTVPRRGVGPAALWRQSSPGREAGRVCPLFRF